LKDRKTYELQIVPNTETCTLKLTSSPDTHSSLSECYPATTCYTSEI